MRKLSQVSVEEGALWVYRLDPDETFSSCVEKVIKKFDRFTKEGYTLVLEVRTYPKKCYIIKEKDDLEVTDTYTI